MNAPANFNAVVVTPPAVVDAAAIQNLLKGAKSLMSETAKFAGHRVVHARQITKADSSTVAVLLDLAKRAAAHNCEFVLCDPPKLLDNFLDIYLPGSDRDQRIFYTDRDDPADCPVPWIPPFMEAADGRIDLWRAGQWHASYYWTLDGIKPA